MNANARSVVSEEANPFNTGETMMMHLVYLQQQLQISGVRSGGEGAGWLQEERPRAASSTSLWKTPFEIDAPRHLGRRPKTEVKRKSISAGAGNDRDENGGNGLDDSPCSSSSSSSRDENMKSAWAGIDELLDQQSLDGSLAISTTEILPNNIVRAMKMERSRSSISDESYLSNAEDDGNDRGHENEGVVDYDGDGDSDGRMDCLRTLKVAMNKHEQVEASNSMPSLFDPSKSRIYAESLKNSRGIEASSAAAAAADGLSSRTGGSKSASSLFDVFLWSAKDNVDQQKQRKTKTNQSLRFTRTPT